LLINPPIIEYPMDIMLQKPRKVIKWGYSFIMTLPKEWVTHRGLSKGSMLSFKVNGEGNLVVIPIKK